MLTRRVEHKMVRAKRMHCTVPQGRLLEGCILAETHHNQVRMPGVRASLKLLQGSELQRRRPEELSSKFPRPRPHLHTRQQTIPTHRLLPVSCRLAVTKDPRSFICSLQPSK